MTTDLTRRELLREAALIGAAAAAVRAAGAADAKDGKDGKDRSKKPGAKFPTIKLGKLEVSRLILGTNPFWGYAHREGDLGKQMRAYYTDERIIAVLDEAAAHGITTVTSPPDKRWLDLWKRYRDKGGKLRLWIAQPHSSSDMKGEIRAAGKHGAHAMFIQGQRADAQFTAGRFDVVREWVDLIRSFNVPAGIASHRSDTHLEYERRKIPADFYYQCFYRDDRFLPADRVQAVATLRKLDKPVIGYKILAAGRLKPEDGFGFAFKHLRAKDGVCVGVFPKDDPDQVEEDARLTARLSARPSAKRPRTA